ncbi:hypothetical protein GCM10010406_28570 [Streptomyces thermolineatus]|uniref:Integral membrane protein n=1 Tax=Streptomyces thermolineatus TaxID=44033 RepID=A0ABN3LUW0_9ACTN
MDGQRGPAAGRTSGTDAGEDDGTPLLPVSGAVLRGDPRLAESVRRIGAAHGVDYFDDAAVARTLEEHRRTVRKAQEGPVVWLGALVLAVGLVWLLWVGLGGAGRTGFAAPGAVAARFGPPTGLLLLGVAGTVVFHRRGMRALRHPVLVGYRQVLAAAKAHGVPLVYVPGWLIGSTGSTGTRSAVPLPDVPGPDVPGPDVPGPEVPGPEVPGPDGRPLPAGAPGHAAHAQSGAVPAAPPKPAEVAEYERLASGGGWHDEAGLLLFLAGAGAVGWAVLEHEPLGYAGVLLGAAGVWAWLAGAARGRRERRLREHAVAYVRQLWEAQRAGVTVPELSAPLLELLRKG